MRELFILTRFISFAFRFAFISPLSGAFLYSRSPEVTTGLIESAKSVIKKAGLNPNDFCIIRNQCFLPKKAGSGMSSTIVSAAERNQEYKMLADANSKENSPFWFVGQNFFRATQQVAAELADWFEDPAILSDWLYSQQQHMVFEQPLVRLSYRQKKI